MASQETRPRGVFAAALTPLKPDLSPDHQGLLRHYRWLLEQGCDGIVAQGTTGEANSFSLDERLAMLDRLADSELPPRLIVGTGCCNFPDTVRLSKRALEIGAAGVLVLPPFYYKKVSDDGLFASFAEVIERIGDPRLRLYIYHFPQMTALTISLELIERLLEAYPGTVVGVKNSSGDWSDMAAMLQRFPGFQMFAGTEEYLLATLRHGGPGVMSATVNVLAPQTGELFARWQEPEADTLQEQLSALRRAITGYPAIPALKAIMGHATGDPMWQAVRPPLRPLAAADRKQLVAGLAGAGLDLRAAA